MKRSLRTVAWCGAALAGAVLLVVASALLTLASLGVFAAPPGAWTTELGISGFNARVNVAGLVRLATLPGTAHLLDGRSVPTRSGTLRFARDGQALRVTCAPCRLRHRHLASVPVQLRSVALEVRREGDALDGAVVVDTIRIPFDARLRAASIDLAWQLPSTGFGTVYRALGDAVPEAAFARIEGTVRARGTLSLPSGRGSARWGAEGLEIGGLGTEALQNGWFRFACSQPSGAAKLTITGDGESAWLAVDAMGPYLAAAVLAAEDQRFLQHAGYDEHSVAALLADFEDGRPKRGGSTITQQLARTLFTGGERTAARKLRELLYAIELERTLGKARILELYLNTVDWGPGLCGARSAARAYFGKSPARLSALEAAWLAGVLRNPHAAWEQQFAARQPDRAGDTGADADARLAEAGARAIRGAATGVRAGAGGEEGRRRRDLHAEKLGSAVAAAAEFDQARDADLCEQRITELIRPDRLDRLERQFLAALKRPGSATCALKG